MSPDWTALAPHQPLAAGDARYVPPPAKFGEEIAERVIAGAQTILVGGPAGIGKSTELGRAAALLRGKGSRVACLVPVDLWENMRRLTPERLLLRVAGRVAWIARNDLDLPLNHGLLAALVQAEVLAPSSLDQPLERAYTASAKTLARAVLDEVARLSGPARVTLLIDGMEKVPESPAGAELFDALATLPGHVEQVVVIPWHAAYGSHSETVVRPGEHWAMISPARVKGAPGEPARAFLREVVIRRLSLGESLSEGFRALVHEAVLWSGGIPRTFLQLVADAGTYARLRRDEDWPTDLDLADAVSDLEDSFRRALLPGDTRAALDAEGTDGRELELERKVRLLSRGILLERRDGAQPILRVHPLARRPLDEGALHA